MKNEMLAKMLESKKGDDYDVAVMYSGGKDSAYLLYLLQGIYRLRVLAIMVDNGFEHEYVWDAVERFPKKLGIPLEIIRPDREEFARMFHTLIVETDKFRKKGVNHVCFTCNNILWCIVVKYAKDRNIPFVASGLSLEQLSSGREYPLEPDKLANRIAEKSTRMVYKKNLNVMRKTDGYKMSGELAEFWEQFAENVKGVTTVYPYIYHNESVEKVKGKLVQLGWIPPNKQQIENYISSGCKVMSKVVYELEKLSLIELNEREQVKAMVEKGLLDEGNFKYASYDASKDVVDLSDNIMDELDIKQFLKEECIKQNREYKIVSEAFRITYGDKEIPDRCEVNLRRAVKGVVLDNNKILMIKTNKGDYKFPGGGIKDGESIEECLKREYIEETGYHVLQLGKLIGTVIEQNVDIFDSKKYFSMISDYYLCSIKKDLMEEQNLNEYEAEQDFKPVFVDIQNALSCNKKILKAGTDDVNKWVQRETDVLEKVSHMIGVRNRGNKVEKY